MYNLLIIYNIIYFFVLFLLNKSVYWQNYYHIRVNETQDYIVGCDHIPVSMLSLTMHVPQMSTASQGMMVPLLGITRTSPGTRSVDRASSVSVCHIQIEQGTERRRVERKQQLNNRKTFCLSISLITHAPLHRMLTHRDSGHCARYPEGVTLGSFKSEEKQ